MSVRERWTNKLDFAELYEAGSARTGRASKENCKLNCKIKKNSFCYRGAVDGKEYEVTHRQVSRHTRLVDTGSDVTILNSRLISA